MPEYAGYAMPEDPKQAFNLYRALCNIRMPSGDTGHTLSDDFYTVEYFGKKEQDVIDFLGLWASLQRQK